MAAENPEHNLIDAASLRSYLQARIDPGVAASLEARVRLAWPVPTAEGCRGHSPSKNPDPNQALSFELKRGQLHWLDAQETTQATFWFTDAQAAGYLLSISETAYLDFMQRFMAAQISSDGYLPWAFTLLGLFRGKPMDQTNQSNQSINQTKDRIDLL